MFEFTNRLGQRIALAPIGPELTRVTVGSITVELPFSKQQLERGLTRWIFDGAYLQDALRFLDADQREFLLTGIRPGTFDLLFPEDA